MRSAMVILVLVLAVPASAGLMSRYSFIPSSDPLDPNVIDSVSGLHGIPMGTAAQVGGELVLDGGGYVQLPATVLGDYTSASVEAWLYYPSGSGWSRLFDFGDTFDGGGGYTWFCSPSGPGNLRLALSTGGFPSWSVGEQVVNGPTLTDGSNYHMVCVYDQTGGTGGNAAMRIYLNGALVASNNAVTMQLADVRRVFAYIGKATYDVDPLYVGRFKEFRIYNNPLGALSVLLNGQMGPDNYAECVLASVTPANNAVNIPIMTTLSWSPVEAITVGSYQVYFTADANHVDPNSSPVPSIAPLYSGTNTSANVSGLTNLTQYYWRVDTIAADTTRYVGPRLMFTSAPASPVFTVNPGISAVFAGETAVLTATCHTDSPLLGPIRWFKVGTPDDTEVTAADPDVTINESYEGFVVTSTLTIANVGSADEGNYYARAANLGGTSNSSNGSLIIKQLLAYYPFEGNADDASGNALHGTAITLATAPNNILPSYSAGRVGQAVNLSNTYLNYIDLPDGFSNFGVGLTISLWANPTAAGNWANFIQFSNGAPMDNIFFCRNGTSQTLHFRTANGTTQNTAINGNVAINVNEWQMFTVTLDASGVARLYKNGVRYFFYNNNGTLNTPQVTMPLPNAVTRVNNYIGRSAWPDAYFTGQMDEIRVYNYALTDDEIAMRYYLDGGVAACQVKPTYDFTGDCKVTIEDFAMFATQWLNCGLFPASECN